MSIGIVIRKLRQERGYSQQELAKEIGIDTRRISLCENNKMLPSTHVLKKLANFFNVSIDYILRGDEESVRKVAFQDQELLSYFLEADKMGDEDRKIIKGVIHAFKVKNKIMDFSELSRRPFGRFPNILDREAEEGQR